MSRRSPAFNSVPRVLLYDNLKSAVLERAGDAIRFHPTLLELAAHYRFQPRPVAVARGNEKGRVERAIRFARDAFFAARSFRDLDDLNAQAAAWCEGAAADRPCPEDRARSVRAVFAEETAASARLAREPVPGRGAPRGERGQNPLRALRPATTTRFPTPMCSARLSVLASLDTVRILDGQAAARHPSAQLRPRRADRRSRPISRPWSRTSAPPVPTAPRTACITPHPVPSRCSCAPPSAAPTWACSPAGCWRCSTPTAPPRWRRRSPPHWPKTPRTWARCATSSTRTPTPAASARPSRWSCPTTRACTPQRAPAGVARLRTTHPGAPPMNAPTTTTHEPHP